MKYLRRGIWYVATRLLVVCLILGIAITVFYYAMNLSNLQVILKDGMASRAKVIMGIDSDIDGLARYFQQAYLTADEALISVRNGNSPYSNYNVRGIDHRMEMGFVWTWPWDTSIRLTITESIPRIIAGIQPLSLGVPINWDISTITMSQKHQTVENRMIT